MVWEGVPSRRRRNGVGGRGVQYSARPAETLRAEAVENWPIRDLVP
ncbi:MAG: hypothetical protein AVDCRST_MAG73-550 [uncultured Thermomicrobiales bacterium]|uniref:Uncharacterized protein n=1 Tax=uncultured Thermomicrobiales bacterium TaxID=1645740 RepID=A0A6J4TKU7_9BACT|nr:MAG: hypothetical protein AVDCRST_MAG73-550 [uncultured Thermomicrobiales bacterium]